MVEPTLPSVSLIGENRVGDRKPRLRLDVILRYAQFRLHRPFHLFLIYHNHAKSEQVVRFGRNEEEKREEGSGKRRRRWSARY